MRGIEDLANELVYAIFDYLDDQSLSSLSLVSRALHRPALETVIIRLGGSSNMEDVASFHDGSFALLRAVRSALFIQSLSFILVTISAKENLIFLAELTKLFNRMRHIYYVRIYISSSTGPMEGDVMLKMAHRTLASLAGKNCTTLILDGWDMPDSKSEFISHEGGEIFYSNSARNSQPDIALPLIRTLIRLDLKNCRIFVKSILRWILDTANQSRITDFSIRQLSPHDSQCSNIALSLLTLPYLTTFTVSSPEINVDTLLLFLYRHPALTDLSLSADRLTALNHSLTPPTFPNLRSLSITSYILQRVLTLAIALPQILNHVTLWPSLRLDSDTEHLWSQSMQDALICLSECKGVRRLVFSFPSQRLVKAWLTSERRNLESLMASVTTVGITTPGYHSFDVEMEPILVNWFSLFPAVEHIEINDDMLATEWDGAAFVSRLAKECPCVQTVRIGWSQLYNLSDLDEGSDPKP